MCVCVCHGVCVVCGRKIIDRNNVLAYTMKDVRKLGIEEVVKRALEHVSPKYVRPGHFRGHRRRHQSARYFILIAGHLG